MKRLSTLIFAPILLASSLALAVPLPAKAADQTDAQATACYQKYNNKSYGVKTKEFKSFSDSNCAAAKGGNCPPVSDEKIPGNQRITCTKTPASSSDSSGDSDSVQDPAIVKAASCNKNHCDLVSNYINPIIGLLTILVGIAVVIGIIIGGIQVITSAGDPQQNVKGKNHIRDALIGLVAYILLFAFLQFLIPGGIG